MGDAIEPIRRRRVEPAAATRRVGVRRRAEREAEQQEQLEEQAGDGRPQRDPDDDCMPHVDVRV